MDKINIKAEKRKIVGRKVKKLREEGILPGNIYGKKFKSQSIKLDLLTFRKVFSEAGETGLVEIAVNGDKHLTLIKNIQTNPVTDDVVHVDFLKVSLKEKVSAMIPLGLAGEAPAEKQGLGTIVQYIDEVEVEALPMDLPEKFELDISVLKEQDQQLKISDLKVDKKKITINHEEDQILVRVEEVSEEEVVEPVAVAEEGEEDQQEEQADDDKNKAEETPSEKESSEDKK